MAGDLHLLCWDCFIGDIGFCMIHSYSMLRDFKTCPRLMNHRYILKDLPREAKTKQQRWGDLVHKAMAERLNQGIPLPDAVNRYETFCGFNGYRVSAELKLGMTSTGHACDFWDKQAFGRGVIDVHVSHEEKPVVAAIADWKTGKRREDPAELEFHALLLKARYPALEQVFGWYVWLQDMQVGKKFDLSHFGQTFASIKQSAEDIARCQEMDNFPPRQGPLCPWCPVKTCEFNPSQKP